MKEIVQKQRQYFRDGYTKDINFRLNQLKRLKEAIIHNEDNILDAIKKDLGKCTIEGYGTEIGIVINEIDFIMKNIRNLSKPVKVKTPLIYFGGSSFITPEPYGIALIIGPWNYPFNLVISPLVGAIAAGNCSVVKPSEFSPNVSELICKIIKDTFHEQYVTCILGGAEASSELLKQKFDIIFFTGGTSIGKIVMEAAAKNLTPVTLELGGKSPCIVDKNSNIKYAAKRIAWGKFLNAGQTCVAPDYLMVHKEVKKELIENIIKTIEEFYSSDPSESCDYARIINEKHFDRLTSMLSDGDIVYGGSRIKEKLYISPTIIDSVSADSNIMQNEIFGPILPVMEYSDIDDAIHFINERPKPLALYFFSSSKNDIEKVLRDTSSGGVCINDTISHMTTSYLPFGGVGESGLGSYHGRASFDTFSHKKSVLKSQILFDIKLKYPPYNIPINLYKKILKMFLG